MKKVGIRLLAVVCACVMLLAGCSKKKDPEITLDMNNIFAEREFVYTMDTNDSSQTLHLTTEQAEWLLQQIDAINVQYDFAKLYELEECFERFAIVPHVEEHVKTALDENGCLTAEHLFEIVRANNSEKLEENGFLLTEPNDEDLMDVCSLIVMSVEEIWERYPDIDKDRVLCNLADLKIFFKGGMLSLAEVTPERVLHISESSELMAQMMFHDNAYRNTLIHETVHIVQFGCVCEAEQLEQVRRRCGFAYTWSGFEMDTTDNTWLPEGSAEQLSSLLSGYDPITYLYMIDYINTLNIATMYQDGVPANYAQSLSFYDDIQVLFDLFGCQTQDQCEEVLSMLISVNLIQIQPSHFYEKYDEIYNADTTENEEEKNAVFFTLKPDICMTFAKQYYRNMVRLLSSGETITANDVCFMIQLFEMACNGHMSLESEEKSVYNQEFVDAYTVLRDALMQAIDASNAVEFEAYYSEYQLFIDDETNVLNASMRWSDPEKLTVYYERLSSLSDLYTSYFKL